MPGILLPDGIVFLVAGLEILEMNSCEYFASIADVEMLAEICSLNCVVAATSQPVRDVLGAF